MALGFEDYNIIISFLSPVQEHEKALMDAIEKIAYVPDRSESTEEPDHDIGHWQVERVTQSASGNAAGHGIPCIDLQDSEYD